MNIKLAEKLADVMQSDDTRIIDNYSGRGTYGSETAAVVVPSTTAVLTELLREVKAGRLDRDDLIACGEIKPITSDSLGFDIVLY